MAKMVMSMGQMASRDGPTRCVFSHCDSGLDGRCSKLRMAKRKRAMKLSKGPD